MEEWERQFDANFDLLAEAYDAIDAQLHDLGGEPPCQVLGEYAHQLARRWQVVYAPVNEVVERPGSIYEIRNYDLKMYRWFAQRNFPHSTATPRSLYVEQGDLTPSERKQFRERAHKA